MIDENLINLPNSLNENNEELINLPRSLSEDYGIATADSTCGTVCESGQGSCGSTACQGSTQACSGTCQGYCEFYGQCGESTPCTSQSGCTSQGSCTTCQPASMCASTCIPAAQCGTCQATGQTCTTTCESSCQTACESSCQTSCEVANQVIHKTLVSGTAYTIEKGNALVNGTGYGLSKGRTLVGGTGYDIPLKNGLFIYDGGSSILVDYTTNVYIVMAGVNYSGGSLSISGGYLNLTGLAGSQTVVIPPAAGGGTVTVPYGRYPYYVFGKINLTDYSKLHITMGAQVGTVAQIYVQTSNSFDNPSGTTNLPSGGTNAIANTTTTIDISAKTGEQYIILMAGNGTTKCSAIWLTP